MNYILNVVLFTTCYCIVDYILNVYFTKGIIYIVNVFFLQYVTVVDYILNVFFKWYWLLSTCPSLIR